MSLNYKGICSLLGGFLIHLTLGTFYTIGNMNSYLSSYLRNRTDPDVTSSSVIWINTGFLSGMGFIMLFAGMLEKKTGTIITCIIGSSIFSISTALTYFSINKSFVWVILSYGVIPSFGSGITYAAPLVNSMKWFPGQKGVVTGITSGGFGLGALIFNQVQTFYLNPDNLKPLIDQLYFDEASILDKVPSLFLILSGIYGILQLIGIALIFSADKHLEKPNLSKEELNKVSTIGNENALETPVNSDVTPLNALKSPQFIVLWTIFAIGNLIMSFISTFYKSFGNTFIIDDHYLAIVGSISSIFNAVGRLVWGKLMDRFKFKYCASVMFGLLSLLMFTFIFTDRGGKVMYTIWVISIYFSFSGIFSMFPANVAQTFGSTHASTIYGMVFTAPAITGIIGAFLLDLIMTNFGWFISFCVVGGMSATAMAITLIFYRDCKLHSS